MKNLSKTSGLEISLNNDELIYDEGIFETEPKARTYKDAKDVYLEKGAPDQDLYYMYRCFEAKEDTGTFESNKLEYDITVIKAGKIGPEPIKTVGHYHPRVPDTDVTFPEVYEVIEGRVIYLLQTIPNADQEVDVLIVEAEAGDKVVVPPNYSHISINPGNQTTVESNIQRRDLPASVDYDAIKERNGEALYFDGGNWTENFNYKVRSLKHLKPNSKPDWGLSNKPLYTSFIESPEKFKWLTEPQNYDFSDVWTGL